MIRQNKTDVILRYSTGLSTLKFKDRDPEFMETFYQDIEIYASLVYRSAPNIFVSWYQFGADRSNFELLRKQHDIKLHISSVLSIYNYETFGDFYVFVRQRMEYGS